MRPSRAPRRKPEPIAGRDARRVEPRRALLVLALVAAAITVTWVDSWRTTAIVTLAATLVAATRVRFAGRAGAGLLLLAAVAVLARGPIGDDVRPAETSRGSAHDTTRSGAER